MNSALVANLPHLDDRLQTTESAALPPMLESFGKKTMLTYKRCWILSVHKHFKYNNSELTLRKVILLASCYVVSSGPWHPKSERKPCFGR